METENKEFYSAMQQEQRRLKLEAVEDCIRVKKQLAQFNIIAHQDVYSRQTEVFDKYWDCDMETLHKELEALSAEASKFARELHWSYHFNNITILPSNNEPRFFRQLGEDEMDKED